jgi:asparagine synthase (glutamine-hydrolysing)
MCGITGIYAFNQIGRLNMINLAKATEAISSRGPDNQGHFHDEFVGLGHRRLSIIDTSAEAHQPMTNKYGRYTIVYNGEIYNFKQLRQELEALGFHFNSASDTEVLLNLYIRDKEACIKKINGFFSFAIYDSEEKNLFVGRDRYGIKPLHYYIDDDKLIFASEVKSIMAYGIDKQIDFTTLFTYLQLNYIPAPQSMLIGIKKLMPGHYINIKNGQLSVNRYYEIEPHIKPFSGSFDAAVSQFRDTMEKAVGRRLVADVPLGTFLSGGLDSTVVSAIAARHVDGLKTFSIGFKDEPFFDETNYANKAAKMLNTDHTVFKLTNNDLYAHVFDMLDYLDEPFADSSALAVYILSKETRKHVTVALSGDGADEIFAGYNKHAALLKMKQNGWESKIVKGMNPLWKILPKSRNSTLANRFRQLNRYAEAVKMSPQARYWSLAAIADEDYAKNMLLPSSEQVDNDEFWTFQAKAVHGADAGITSNLMADLNLVLPNDMLTKVDLMSMAHGLEIRVPFLDHRVVEFAFGLPDEMKITPSIRKRVVQEAFRAWIPKEIYNRPKKGFEVPLLKWFRTEMRPLINDDLLADEFIRAQGIFSIEGVSQLKKQLYSRNLGDAHAKIWALIVFQWWWKKYFSS